LKGIAQSHTRTQDQNQNIKPTTNGISTASTMSIPSIATKQHHEQQRITHEQVIFFYYIIYNKLMNNNTEN